jgi:hypothetical protein
MLTCSPDPAPAGPPCRVGKRLAFAILIVLVAKAPAAALSLQEVGEWVVACDNLASCSLVNASHLTQIRVAQPSPFGMSRICIHRRGGPADEAQIFVTLPHRGPKNHAAQQDGRLLRLEGAHAAQPDVVLRHRSAEHWQVPAAQTGQLLAALDQNTRLHVMARDGTVIERLSVAGIDQALAMVDQAQLRAGTVTALRATGSAPASAVPARPPIPTLVTAPLPRLAPGRQPSAASQRLRREACGAPGLDATVGYRLLGDQHRADRTLWVTPCDPKPGLRRDLFVIENADGSAAPVAFPGFLPVRPTGQEGMLATPRFDPATGIVREQWLAPAMPDKGEACAIQRQWGWTGQTFELAEERRTLSCAGIVSGYWPRTYTRPLITPAADGAAATATPFQPPC